MEALRKTHDRLAEHFALQRSTDQETVAPTYFADHGLTAEECESLRGLVQDGLRCKPLESFDWSSAYLPLLVCAVEVGYGYEGNGTDFWPTLEQSLGHSFGLDDRERLSNWFAKASARYDGVTPGDSDWEKAFCHIAWPITHAVAAKDIRRPFADCLRRYEGSLEDDDLAIAMQLSWIPTNVGSRRFRTWLSRQSVVAGIVRDLLGGPKLHETGLFSERFRTRLIEDLRSEPEIQRAVRSVQTRRKTESKRKEKKAAAKASEPDDIRFGEFFLKQDEHGMLELFGELPEMPRSIQKSLRKFRRKWQPRPWGFPGAAALPSDTLRSTRGTFSVDLSNVARADEERAFFVGLDELALDTDCDRWLRSIRFHASDKLVFQPITGDGDSSHAITTRTPQSGKVWVLSKTAVEWPEVDRERIGVIDGGEVHEVDASSAVLRDWLGWPAANATGDKDELPIQWLRPSPVSTSADGKDVFTTDDEIGILVLGERAVELVLRQNRTELDRQPVHEVALVCLESPGEYELVVLEKGKSVQSLSFSIVDEKGDGFIEPDPEAPWRSVLSHVDAGVTELSRNDLFNRRLTLDVEGDRAIENLTAVVTVSPGDVSSKVFLPRIPARLGVNHPVWSELLDRLPPSVLQSACDLSIQVEIANVTTDEWRLEAELQNLWWNVDADGLPVATSDHGVFETRHACIVSGKPILKPVQGDPFVSVAFDADGNPFTFDARVSVVGYSRLQLQLKRPNRFLRQMDDVEENIGLRSIASRYLQASSASSSSLTAEVNRVGSAQTLRDWILQSVCGSNWVGKQREGQQIENSNPVAVWWQAQLGHPDLIQPKPDQPRVLPESLPDLMLAEFAAVLPLGWWDGAVLDISADDAASLDTVFQHLLDGEDIYIDSEVLTASLREANEKLCGGHLADLVIPATGGDELMSWSISDMSIAAIAGALLDWSKQFLGRGRGRQSWTVEELQDWLNLLLYPERLRKRPWQSVLEKLLNDRSVARAGAFIAWRVEQNARIDAIRERALTAEPTAKAVGLVTDNQESVAIAESLQGEDLAR